MNHVCCKQVKCSDILWYYTTVIFIIKTTHWTFQKKIHFYIIAFSNDKINVDSFVFGSKQNDFLIRKWLTISLYPGKLLYKQPEADKT